MNMIAPRRRRLVLVGNGMAGVRAVEEVLARAGRAHPPGAFDITVFGAEPHGNYNRILLSPVLAGEKDFDDIVTHDRAWYDDNGIELIAGDPVVAHRPRGADGAERARHRAPLRRADPRHRLDSGDAAAAGRRAARCRRLPRHRRCRDDARRLPPAAGSAVVIGGGLLGLEAAHGLARRGMDVSVVHLMPTLMERQLDPASAELLAADLRGRGIAVLTGATTQAILGEGRVRARGARGRARAAGRSRGDGRRHPPQRRAGARMRPRLRARHRGRRHDAHRGPGDLRRRRMRRASRPDLRPRRAALGHGQGRGRRISRRSPTAPTPPAATATRLKVTGIDVFSAGDFLGDAGTEDIVFHDAARGVYKRLVLRGRPSGRRGAVRRCARRRLVLRPDPRRQRCRRPARPARVRPRGCRRRPAGRAALRRCPTAPRSAAATASARAPSWLRSASTASSRWTRCARAPRPPPPAAAARVRWRRCWRCAGADAGGAGGEARVRLHRARATTRCAAAIRERKLKTMAAVMQRARLDHAGRLRSLPPGAQLLPALRLAGRIPRRRAVAASSTSACTPTSRRTAPIRWCRACGAA